MIVDWTSAFDMVLAGGLGAAGTLLVTSIAKRRKSNGFDFQCAGHQYLKEKIDELADRQEQFIPRDVCHQKHNELLRRIDDLRNHIDDKHEALMEMLKAKQERR